MILEHPQQHILEKQPTIILDFLLVLETIKSLLEHLDIHPVLEKYIRINIVVVLGLKMMMQMTLDGTNDRIWIKCCIRTDGPGLIVGAPNDIMLFSINKSGLAYLYERK